MGGSLCNRLFILRAIQTISLEAATWLQKDLNQKQLFSALNQKKNFYVVTEDRFSSINLRKKLFGFSPVADPDSNQTTTV